ncbi:MAG: outer membrane beta-barrel protein [Spirochaetes bacterium]|nr:outer membrane beta-barrel protein [Spirochaetota bacterium]
MKKLHLVSVLGLAAILSASTVYADGFEVKAGAASIKDTNPSNKVGFDAALAYTLRLDRFFAIMPEVSFNWLNYTGSSASIGGSGISGGSTPSTSIYTLPVLANARIYIPMGGDDTPIFQPYITAGLGYGWMSYNQSSTPTSSAATATASGFMYQAVVGGLLNLGMISDGSASSTNLLLEVGYRGGLLSTSNSQQLDVSGILVRAGVNLSF